MVFAVDVRVQDQIILIITHLNRKRKKERKKEGVQMSYRPFEYQHYYTRFNAHSSIARPEWSARLTRNPAVQGSSPVLNLFHCSLGHACKWPTGLPPASWDS